MVKGRAATMTQDYKRDGATALFAALDVLTGKVIGKVIGPCLPRHRHNEFLRFLRVIDAEVPDGLDVHLILDNYSTHEHAKVQAWRSVPDLIAAIEAYLDAHDGPKPFVWTATAADIGAKVARGRVALEAVSQA